MAKPIQVFHSDTFNRADFQYYGELRDEVPLLSQFTFTEDSSNEFVTLNTAHRWGASLTIFWEGGGGGHTLPSGIIAF